MNIPTARLLLRSVYLKGHQDGHNEIGDMTWEKKTLAGFRKLIEAEKLHPEMSDALAQDTLMHEYGYDKAINKILELFK
jgi:regulator of sigma D